MLSRAFVGGEYAELGAPKIAAKAFESPNDATGLEIKRSSMSFRVEHSSADVRDGFDGTVLLLLFEGGAKPVDANVAVHVERTWPVGDSVPNGEKQNRRSRTLHQDF